LKILFLHAENNQKNLINDYQSDLLLHGLRELYGDDVVDYPGCWHLYGDEVKKRCFDTNEMWGKGFNIKNILDNFSKINREDIYSKIKNKFFDLIIFSSCRRSLNFLDEVIKYNNNFIFIDGEDDQIINYNLSLKSLYFKRELNEAGKNLLPINFAIPEKKIINNLNFKYQDILAPLIPSKKRTYIYDYEDEYNKMYQNSLFAVTYKKAGWDCYRHYEILMNGCIPIFFNIEDCPKLSMTSLPKKLLTEINNNFQNILDFKNPFDTYKIKHLNVKIFFKYYINILLGRKIETLIKKNIDQILEYKTDLLNYTKQNLTTKILAKKTIQNMNLIKQI
jgi:hypothetical protein